MLEPHRYRLANLCVVSCTVVLISCFALLMGWILIPISHPFVSATMKANTCVAFMCAASAVIFYVRSKNEANKNYAFLTYILTSVVLFIGLVTSMEYLAGSDLGIDSLLVQEPLIESAQLFPARMSPLSAVYLVLLGFSILFLDTRVFGINLTVCFLLPLFLFSTLSMIGYLFDYPAFYQVGNYVKISWLTATCFIIMSLGIFMAPNKFPPIPILVSPGLGGMTARSLLPIVFFIPISVGIFWLYGRNSNLFSQEFGISIFVLLIIAIFISSIVFISSKLDNLEVDGKEVILREQILKSRFMEVIGHSPILLWGTDINGKFTFYEGKSNEHLKNTAEDFIGQNSYKFYKSYPKVISSIQKALSGESLTVDTVINDRIYSTRYSPSKNESGEIVGMFAVSTDLTDLKDATDKARASDDRIRTFTDVMPTIAFICNASGEALYFNKAWFEYTDAAKKQTFKSAWMKYLSPDMVEDMKQKWATSIKELVPFEMEFLLRSSMGEYRWHLGRARPVLNSHHIVSEWYGTITDIHEQKLLQERAETMNEKLTEALRARDEFLSIASHELKTPLTSLRLQNQLFQRKIKKQDLSIYEPHNVNAILAQTDTQVNRLIHLVDDMLDIARIRSGKLAIEKNQFDLAESIHELMARMKAHFINRIGKVPEVNTPPKLPLYGDRLRIEQVLTNLLTNAIRYGKSMPISVTASINAGNILLAIKDEGIGIAEENLEKIFTKFERAVSHYDISGLGLGLYISKQIIEGHGGKIWVESELNVGSTFYIELPTHLP